MQKNFFKLLIADRSGSMLPIYLKTLREMNQELRDFRQRKDQRPEEGHFLSVTLFDGGPESVYDCTTAEVPDFNEQTYRLQGCTAIHDSVTVSLRKLQRAIQQIGQHAENEVEVTLLTDGCETCSKQFNYQAMQAQMNDLEKENGWKIRIVGSSREDLELTQELGRLVRRRMLKRRNSRVSPSLLVSDYQRYLTARKGIYRACDPASTEKLQQATLAAMQEIEEGLRQKALEKQPLRLAGLGQDER